MILYDPTNMPTMRSGKDASTALTKGGGTDSTPAASDAGQLPAVIDPRPRWVVPVAAAGGVLVVGGGIALLASRRKKGGK